jgi:hypothetical protein
MCIFAFSYIGEHNRRERRREREQERERERGSDGEQVWAVDTTARREEKWERG